MSRGADILLVDDEAGIRNVLGISLADLGYTVHTAADAASALTIMNDVGPPITLTDIKMPGMNGIELLKEIKARYPETEVIMLTGHGDMDLAIESLKHRATDFISKPISDDALTIALRRAGERIAMRRQLETYTRNLEELVEEKSRQLIEAERLAAVGETVAGLSHTIKNIAGGLDGGMFVLQKGIDLHDTEYLNQGWELVRSNVDRIKSLSLDLLNFSKTERLEYRDVHPEAPARDVIALMHAKAGDHGISLDLDAVAGLPTVRMDPEGIHQCLLNLVTNAIDACLETDPQRGGQHVTISIDTTANGILRYRVLDTCCGMDEKTRRQLFKRFFTTKGDRGTGIGLMLTRTIVHRHKGTLAVASTPGQGSCFTIQLPIQPADR